jgi:signal transduction histidine kinase
VNHGQARLARRSLVDAAALAEETGRAARLAQPDHPITIEVAGPLLVRVDPLAVSRILGNLLDNAAAYSSRGAPIVLSAGREGCMRCWPSRIKDQGSPLTDRDRIFQRYARLDQAAASPGGGLGLGLYIARRLARANRGELQGADPPGRQGARFALNLPLATPVLPRTDSPGR